MSSYDTTSRPPPRSNGKSRRSPPSSQTTLAPFGHRGAGRVDAAPAHPHDEPSNAVVRTMPADGRSADELLVLRERIDRIDQIVAGLRIPPGVTHENDGATVIAGIEMLCTSRLRESGRSDALIDQHLGAPDVVVPNPHRATGGDMRLYSSRRVQQAERAAEYADAMARAAAQRAARTGASEAEVRAGWRTARERWARPGCR